MKKHCFCEMTFIEKMKNCSVRKNSGKNKQCYLVRMDWLSRDANPGAIDSSRKLLSLVLAINGLSNTNLKRELMINCGLNWNKMTKHLGSKLTLLNRRSGQYAIILRVAHIQLS